MAGEKPDVLLIGAKKPVMVKGLEPKVTLHYLVDAKDPDAFLKSVADKVLSSLPSAQPVLNTTSAAANVR